MQDDGSTIGGIDTDLLAGDIIQGQSSILYGSGTATSEYLAPSDSIASWESFFSQLVATEAGSVTWIGTPPPTSAATGAFKF